MTDNKPLMKKFIILLVCVFVVMFLVSPLYAQDNTGSAQGEATDEITVEIVDGKEVIHTISEKPSEEDKDWPIIYHEVTTERDKETGRLYTLETTIRELKETDISYSLNNCPEDVMKQLNGSSCSYYGPTSVQQTASGSGIQATVKHFAYKYCNGVDCNYYKPYKVERSWWRPSAGYNVTGAWLQWGCSGACLVCGGGTSSFQYNSSSMTVGWNNTHESHVYTTSITWFAIMQKVDVAGAHITAISHSAQVDVAATMP